MGLDVYVGPLTRYYAGTWKTVVQQAADAGAVPVPVHIIRPAPEPADKVTDPEIIADTARKWQSILAQGLETDVAWSEGGDLPYWTDKPDWDGYGAVLLLAAYQVCPELTPNPKRGFLFRKINPELPRRFGESPAYRAAVKKGGGEYPSLLLGAEWWLPIAGGPALFEAEALDGGKRRMSRVRVLHDELTRLNQATVQLDSDAQEATRWNGPTAPDQPVSELAPFGLSVLLGLAERALTAKQPLLLDY
jgi:hypothetical protein